MTPIKTPDGKVSKFVGVQVRGGPGGRGEGGGPGRMRNGWG